RKTADDAQPGRALRCCGCAAILRLGNVVLPASFSIREGLPQVHGPAFLQRSSRAERQDMVLSPFTDNGLDQRELRGYFPAPHWAGPSARLSGAVLHHEKKMAHATEQN